MGRPVAPFFDGMIDTFHEPGVVLTAHVTVEAAFLHEPRKVCDLLVAETEYVVPGAASKVATMVRCPIAEPTHRTAFGVGTGTTWIARLTPLPAVPPRTGCTVASHVLGLAATEQMTTGVVSAHWPVTDVAPATAENRYVVAGVPTNCAVIRPFCTAHWIFVGPEGAAGAAATWVVGAGVDAGGCGSAENAALTLRAVATASAHVLEGPLHAPPHDENSHPVPGVEVIVTTVPGTTSVLHGVEHDSPSAAMFTLPPPEIEPIDNVFAAMMDDDGADAPDSPAALAAVDVHV